MKKVYAIGSVIIFVVLAVFLFDHKNVGGFKAQLAKVSVHYNQSVKVEYGKAIKVAKVVDGDTIQLVNGEYLRYIGIDTPEEFDPRKPVQCYAKEAADRNKALVEGKDIIFYNDVSVHDKYGRWLGFVYLADGTFVNKELVLEGYAFSYPYKPDNYKQSEFDNAETKAQQSNLGIWSHCDVNVLKGGRKQTNNI